MRRLFWRAGFGSAPDEARAWAARGRAATLAHLLDFRGPARLSGPPVKIGRKLDPVNEWGNDVLWWMDRMVRTTRPLEERLTLFWHDHFAVNSQDTPLMLRQNRKLRAHALGSFPALLSAVTTDTAMQLFLSLAGSEKGAPNENFARELMELFTLGGGYGEHDVREAARALTGWRAVWSSAGLPRVAYDARLHDRGRKTIFGHRGHWGWRDVLRLCVAHPRHAGFLVDKLWAYFVATPPDAATRRRLISAYRRSNHGLRPVVAAILAHPALYADLDGPDMVKCPLVYVAGMMRTTGQGIRYQRWEYDLWNLGQVPFQPPSVAGWDWGGAWLSSTTMRTRHAVANYVADGAPVRVCPARRR